MSNLLLPYSMFQDVFFPSDAQAGSSDDQALSLRRSVAFSPHLNLHLEQISYVVFDLETTGLDPTSDRIIEIGAFKIKDGKTTKVFDTLVDPECEISPEAQKISGIDNTMVKNQPKIEAVLPKFFEFIQGGILVAHNAAFDMGFIKANANRMGIDFTWPAFCTLKLARELLPDLERKNLDTLAAHYKLTFEARHRSIGDVKVTAAVLEQLMNSEGSYLRTWRDMEPFHV